MGNPNYPLGADAALNHFEYRRYRKLLVEDQAWIDTEAVGWFNLMHFTDLSQENYDKLITDPSFQQMRNDVAEWLAERRLKEMHNHG